jgi:tetratricopeptide (TPR) repeat protein
MELINAQLMLATACIRQDKRDEAKAIYRQLELAEKESFKKEDSDPFLRASHASRLLDMARIEDNLDKYHEAEAYFKQYLDYIAREYGKNNGDYANGLEALADIYHSQKKFKEEEGVLKELLSMLKVTRAGELHPYLVMASNQFALKRQDVANRYLNTYHERLLSKELRPSPSELSKFLCYLADTYDRCHLYKEEAAIADEIAKINSQVVFAEAEAFTIRARMLAGRAYAQADEYEKSIDRFKQAMQLTKNGYPIESFLAARAIFDQHFKRKKYQEAYQWFEKEIKMFPPPSLNAYQNLLLSLDKARLLEVENKKEEAAEAYLEAAHDCLNHKYSDYPKEYEMEFRKHELLLAMHVHWKKNSQQAVSLCEDILKNSSEKILESSDFLERIVVEYYKILIGQGRTKEANALAEKYPKELRDEAALYKEQQKL